MIKVNQIYFYYEREGITINFKKRIGLVLTLLLIFNFIDSSTIFAENLENNLLVSGTDGGFKAVNVKDKTKEPIEKQYEAKNKFIYIDNGISYTTSAFDFHIFSKKATINAHTNGNIATKDLYAGGQTFGTNQDIIEDNYFINSVDSITNISSKGNIIIGPNIAYKLVDHDNSLEIGTNSGKLSSDVSSRVYKEEINSSRYIDIENELENLKKISELLSSNKTTEGVILSEPNGENQSITVNGNVGNSNNYYLNIPANKISDGNNKRVLKISIPDGKTLIINVNMADVSINTLEKLVTEINNSSNSEDVVGHDNNILWNLYDSSNKDRLFSTGSNYALVGTSVYFMGTILAPNANIQYGAVNGSIIANETKQNGQESHKWDFTGHKDPDNKSTSLSLEARKTLEGKELSPNMFSFELWGKKDENATENTLLQTVQNDSNGNIKFNEIKYTKAGIYNYEIREVKGNLEGITYDEKVFDIVVNVTDDGNGNLVAVANYPENGVIFTNSYKAKSATADIVATKNLVGKDLKENMFSFKLIDKDGKEYLTKNDANGNIKFEALTFTEAGIYNYKIVEVDDKMPGITYDSRTVDVVIKVRDNGEGQLIANTEYPNKKPEFINNYKTEPINLYIKATKKLLGMDLTSGMFSFELKGKDGSLAIAKNNSEGLIEFSPITYNSVGSYEYTLKEVKGKLDGIIYDDDEFKITVNVTDDGKGHLVATVVYPKDGVVFENKLIKGSLEIIKTDAEDGKPLKDVEFTLKDSEGKIVKVGKTDNNGRLVFEDLKYGKYTYQETLAKEGYIIDSKEYPFEIKENGVIVKASIINERTPEKPNKPENPSKPQIPNTPSKSGSPNTGDTGIAFVLILGVLGIGGLVINNKKKVKEKN